MVKVIVSPPKPSAENDPLPPDPPAEARTSVPARELWLFCRLEIVFARPNRLARAIVLLLCAATCKEREGERLLDSDMLLLEEFIISLEREARELLRFERERLVDESALDTELDDSQKEERLSDESRESRPPEMLLNALDTSLMTLLRDRNNELSPEILPEETTRLLELCCRLEIDEVKARRAVEMDDAAVVKSARRLLYELS